MTKVLKPVPDQVVRGAVMMLPPFGSGFQNYEVGENGDYNNSFVAFFARRNFLVVGYSPRVDGLTAGSCESGAIDCSQWLTGACSRLFELCVFGRSAAGCL